MKLSVIPQPKSVRAAEGVCQKEQVTEHISGDIPQEGYRILIEPSGIHICYGDEAGRMYANTTLAQLSLQFPEELPCAEIEDFPSATYRAFHIDCARHFFPLDELKKMVDMAAYFKMNRFHFHFSDDQGWRIESKRFPNLHKIGAFRQGDHFGDYASDVYEGGYYSQDEIRQLVAFCKERGVEIVPEIDIPGHTSAILSAYPQLGCEEKPVSVKTSAGIYRDILCAGKENVYAFLRELLDELLELFPGEYIHIGGDECPKTAWKECPQCQERLRAEGLETYQQLQGYMANRIATYLHKRGRKTICWNDAAKGDNLDLHIVLQCWTEDQEGFASRHAARGGKIIVSPMMHAYCDYPHAFISVKSVHELDLMPQEFPEGSVLGGECLVWTEYIRDAAYLESRAWPRFCASAEATWCAGTLPDYEDFAERLRVIFPVFAQHGIAATQETLWTPSMEEGMQELLDFKRNISQATREAYQTAQEEI